MFNLYPQSSPVKNVSLFCLLTNRTGNPYPTRVPSSSPVFSGDSGAQSLVSNVVLCRQLSKINTHVEKSSGANKPKVLNRITKIG
jgi:hypothetical protein